MRICSILTSLTSGGAETLVANLSPEFCAAGHESIVVTLCDAATLDNSIEMEGKLRERIERGGGQVISLGLSARRGAVSGAWALGRLLRKLRPDVIHSHTARALPMLAPTHGAAPLILTHHNSKLSFPPILFRMFDKQVAGYVAISPEIHGDLSRRTDRRIELIRNAAALDFGADGPLEGAGSPATIISVGAISDQKNYKLLIDTARALRLRGKLNRLPIFKIAGGGNRLAAKRSAAREAGFGENVQFLGERSDIPDLLRGADLYFNCSHYEGLSIAMLEAMASALPIIATEVAGNRDLVHQEVNGLLAQAGNPEGLAAAIERVLSDQDLYRRLSAGALAEAGNYSIADSAQRHLAYYADVITD